MTSTAEGVRGITEPSTRVWALFVITIILLSFLLQVWTRLSRAVIGESAGSMTIGPLRGVVQVHGIIILFFTMCWFLSKMTYFRTRFTLTNLSYLYVVISSVAFFSGLLRAPGDFDRLIESRISLPVDSNMYVSSLLAPSSEITTQLLLGNVPFPWGEWVPRILFWWIFIEIPVIFLFLIATLFRREWITVEKVPFPHVAIYHELLKRSVDTETRTLRALIPFAIAFFIGMAIQVPIYLARLFPWFPDFYGTRTSCCESVWYVTPDSPLAAIAGISCAERNPVFAGIFYLAPLKIILNAWFWYLVFLVVMQALYSVGYYTGITGLGGCGRTWCTPSFNKDPPLALFSFSNAGGIIGLTVFAIWLSRGFLANTIKAMLGKLPVDRLKEFEKEEPLSYKMTWMLIIVTFLATIAIYMSIGMSFAVALLIPISYFVIWFGNARMQGLAGIWCGAPEIGHSFYRLFIWPTAPQPITSEFVMAQYMTRVMGSNVPDQGAGAALFGGFQNYKMMNLTNSSNRVAFKITLLGIIIAPLMSILAYLWCGYTFGLSNLGISASSALSWWGTNAEAYNALPTPGNWVPNFIAGFIAIGALFVLSTRFIWFPFEPIGFIIATTYNASLSGLWTMFLGAWIAKELTLRLGGSKAYEQIGVPAAVGLVSGSVISRVLFGAISIYRFFFPF